MKIVGMEPSVLKEAYIDQYGEAFAFALYQWYTDNGTFCRRRLPNIILILFSPGQQQQLLQQAARHQDLLSSYLETHAEPSISWLHYIATGQFDRAVTALESKAQGDHDVGHKKVKVRIYAPGCFVLTCSAGHPLANETMRACTTSKSFTNRPRAATTLCVLISAQPKRYMLTIAVYSLRKRP